MLVHLVMLLKVKQLQQHNTQLVQTLFTRQLVEQVLVSLQKQNHSTKAVLKMKKFGLSVLTVTKKQKVNTLLKMAKNQTLFLYLL